jgi:hypothetical protein
MGFLPKVKFLNDVEENTEKILSYIITEDAAYTNDENIATSSF